MLRIFAITFLTGFALAVAPLMQAGSSSDVFDLLQRVEAKAMDIRAHAAQLKTYNRFPTQHSWKTHAFQVEMIRDDVNDMGDLLGKLKMMKEHATERQNKAMNYVIPDAAKLADSAAQAVKLVNENKTEIEVNVPAYDKAVNEIYDTADRIVAAVGFAESWEEVREAREELTS